MGAHELSRQDARRIAIRAQLLDRPRPEDLIDMVRRLGYLQYDQTATVAPSADLVAWSRLGSAYSPDDLQAALDEQRLIELRGLIRPIDDLPLLRAEMAHWPGPPPLRDWQEHILNWVEANNQCREEILERLRADGPLPAAELPDRCDIPWNSSGWTNDRNVRVLLSFMVQRGEVAVAGRDGRDPLWDLAERVYPDEPVPPLDEARRIRAERRLRALGLARERGQDMPGEPLGVGGAGEVAVVEGVRGKWRVDPAQIGQPFAGRAALLSPLDRLVYDRKRMADLFEFDYQLEMYKPVAKRRWGYYALPILYGDRLVGKLDATADRKSGVLRVAALHRDVPFTEAMTAAVDKEIKDLARWLGLHLDRPAG
jgi:uncharacterized protein YcaQ